MTHEPGTEGSRPQALAGPSPRLTGRTVGAEAATVIWIHVDRTNPILIKPDGVGSVASWVRCCPASSARVSTLVALELRTLDVETARAHYGEHDGQALLR